MPTLKCYRYNVNVVIFFRLATGRESDGFFLNVENMVRSTLRSFPKAESNLFGILLQKLSKIPVVSAVFTFLYVFYY